MALDKVQYLKKKILEKLNKHRKEIGEQSFSALCNTVNGTNDYDKLLELNDMDLFIGLMDYINRYKIERASSLLLDTTKKVKEVAECVGIFNVNTFIRLFKKYKDVTPNEYRRKTQEFKDSPLGALPRGESETIS